MMTVKWDSLWSSSVWYLWVEMSYRVLRYNFRSEDDDSKMGLIMVVLSLIFMSGNVLQDSEYMYNKDQQDIYISTFFFF